MSYALDAIYERVGREAEAAGLRFERFIVSGDGCVELQRPSRPRRRHHIEGIKRPDFMISVSRKDLHAALHPYERMMGAPDIDV